jgi:hypothetical protein
LNRRTKLRLILSILLVGFVMSPAVADETTITLNQDTPYVDIPVEATEPTTITIQTITGTPQNNPNFVDSWIELWQDTVRLAVDDDGAYTRENVLASIIIRPIEAGFYFIRATSFGAAVNNYNYRPNGSYVLTWSGVTTIPTATPTTTPSPQPTTEPTPTNEPTPSATPEPTEVSPTPTPTIEPTPTLEPTPQPEPIVDNEPILVVETPLPTPEPIIEEEVIQEEEQVEQIVEEETIETPVLEPELSVEEVQEQIDAEYIAENTIEFEVPTALAEIPGVAEIFAATEAILNVGSDMTQEQREESQSVVVSAIVITQIASMASVSVSQSQSRRFRK